MAPARSGTAGDPLGSRLVGAVAGVATLVGHLVLRRYWLPDSVTEESVRDARRKPLTARYHPRVALPAPWR